MILMSICSIQYFYIWDGINIAFSARQNKYILIHGWSSSVFLYFRNIQWPIFCRGGGGGGIIQVKALMSLWFVFPPLVVILFIAMCESQVKFADFHILLVLQYRIRVVSELSQSL